MKLAFWFIILVSLNTYSKTNIFNKTLDSFKYPNNVLKYKFNSQRQNLEMAYMDIGKKSSKGTFVLLHGKNFSGFYWDRVIKLLKDLGYRVIIPDQIGFGKSSKPKIYQFNFSQLSLNTVNLLKSLNVKEFNLVGHSMGGMLAANIAYEYPELIKKLILINPIGLEDYNKLVEFKDPDFFYNLELNKTIGKVRDYQKKNYFAGEWNMEYEKLLIPVSGQLAGDEWPQIAWNNALTYIPIFSEPIINKYKYIKNKAYLIIGMRDKTGPGRGWLKKTTNVKLGNYKLLAHTANKLLPNSKLYELQGLGHVPFIEDFELFKKYFIKSIND